MAQPRKMLAGLAAVAALLASCGDEELTGPPDADDWLDPAVAPRVVATYPPDGGIGPFNLIVQGYETQPHFTIQLNKLVERRRFRRDWLQIDGFTSPASFELTDRSPYGSDLIAVLGVRVLTLDGHRSLYYEIGHTYTVTVDTTLRDVTGRHPELPYRFSFEPEPHFRVVSVVYPDGSPVGSMAPVALQFNSQPVASIGSSVVIEPAIPGRWGSSPGLTSLTFSHSQPFAFGGTYTLRVEITAMDTHGNWLPEPFVTSFQVQGFQIEDSYPSDGVGGFWPSESIRVRANGIVDSATVRQAFSMQPAVEGTFTWLSQDFRFTPSQDLLSLTPYTVTLSTGLLAWDGTPLSAPYSFTFRTAAFRVWEPAPYDGMRDVPLSDSIQVAFVSHLDPTTAARSLRISPPVPGTLAVRHESRSLVFLPSEPLAPSTYYGVMVSTALRSQRGDSLLAPYTFGFTTGMY